MSEPAGRSTLQQQDCILVVQKVTNRVMRLLQEDDWTILRGHIETVNGKKKNNVVSSDFSSSSFRQSWTLVVLQVKQMKERKVTVRFSCTQTSNQETKDNKKKDSDSFFTPIMIKFCGAFTSLDVVVVLNGTQTRYQSLSLTLCHE